MRYAMLLLAACGPMPSTDAGHDAGSDAGSDAGQTVRITLAWRDSACMACTSSRDFAPDDAEAIRASFNSTLNDWACRIDESDAGVAIDCAPRCGLPSRTDAGVFGCDWAPCLDGPLVCR